MNKEITIREEYLKHYEALYKSNTSMAERLELKVKIAVLKKEIRELLNEQD